MTRIPGAVLNAMEAFTLKGLDWKITMTEIQWREMLITLRASIKMSSESDPFAYDAASPRRMIARMLDEWIDLCETAHAPVEVVQPPMEIYAPQPIRPIPQLFKSEEWCPEADPIVNKAPRMVGIAPGADRQNRTVKAGTTARDLLDSIMGSTTAADVAHLGRNAGTSFYGSFGIIGARLAHSVGLACQNSPWFPAQG